jgi:hypothetical protein
MDKDLLTALFEDGSEDVMDQIIWDFAADDMDNMETPIIS